MQEHVTIEDLEKYLEEDYSQEYLCWIEKIQSHLNVCSICQKKLRRFLMADVVVNDFPGISRKDLQWAVGEVENQGQKEREAQVAAMLSAMTTMPVMPMQQYAMRSEGLPEGLTCEKQETTTKIRILLKNQGKEDIWVRGLVTYMIEKEWHEAIFEVTLKISESDEIAVLEKNAKEIRIKVNEVRKGAV